jgi:hypothetical protein
MSETEALRERLHSWRWLLVVAAAHETGIFGALAPRGLTLEELVGQLGLERRATAGVVEALVEGGFLEHRDGRYALTEAARLLLVDTGNPAYLAPTLIHGRDLMVRWLQLPGILKGEPPGERRSRFAPGNFIATMAISARASAPIVAARCLERWPATRSMLDVGGGPGIHARAFMARGVQVTILDVPEVIALVQPEWAGVEGVRLEAGDFTAGLPEGPFDLALLGNVCHIYGPEENRQLFRRVAAVLTSGGGIAIQDFLLGRSTNAALFGVNMVASTTSGGAWSEAEYREWLTEAGFVDITVEDLDGPERQLILAEIGPGKSRNSD